MQKDGIRAPRYDKVTSKYGKTVRMLNYFDGFLDSNGPFAGRFVVVQLAEISGSGSRRDPSKAPAARGSALNVEMKLGNDLSIDDSKRLLSRANTLEKARLA